MEGGQTVLVSDVHRIRPRSYRERNMLHMKPPRWNLLGEIEAKEIIEVLKIVVKGEERDRKKIL